MLLLLFILIYSHVASALPLCDIGPNTTRSYTNTQTLADHVPRPYGSLINRVYMGFN